MALLLSVLAAAFAGFGMLFVWMGISNAIHLCLGTATLSVRNWRKWEAEWSAMTAIELGQVAGSKGSVNLGILVRYRRPDGLPSSHSIEDLFTLPREALFQVMLDRHGHVHRREDMSCADDVARDRRSGQW